MRIPALLAALVALVVLAGCQVDIELDVDANLDGSGTVALAVGLDADAVARLGDPATAIALGDLDGTAWEVSPPEVDAEGVTWLRARRGFDDPAGLTAALNEVAGVNGPLSGTSLTIDDGWFTTTGQLRGIVNLAGGLAPYTDPDLEATTGWAGLDGLVDQVEADLGTPIAELFDVTVRWTLGGESAVITPALGDPPVVVGLTASEPNTGRRIGTGVAAGVVVVGAVTALVVWLVRRRRRGGVVASPGSADSLLG